MSRYRQNYFEHRLPELRLSCWQLAAFLLTLIVTYSALSTLDYREARSEECARKSNWQYQVTYNPKTDACVKELKNGTTKKD